jgi:hypothetical protein
MSLVGVALRCALVLSATTSVPIPIERMALDAEVIVRGVVRAQETTWSDGNTAILTYSDIEVLAAVKGARAGDVVRVYQVGGTLDGFTHTVHGARLLSLGQQLTFFGKRFRDMVVPLGLGIGQLPFDQAVPMAPPDLLLGRGGLRR